eukprot:2222288-Prymnesium_polylepis.1
MSTSSRLTPSPVPTLPRPQPPSPPRSGPHTRTRRCPRACGPRTTSMRPNTPTRRQRRPRGTAARCIRWGSARSELRSHSSPTHACNLVRGSGAREAGTPAPRTFARCAPPPAFARARAKQPIALPCPPSPRSLMHVVACAHS